MRRVSAVLSLSEDVLLVRILETELVLSMVDSAGNSGGIAPQVYSVIRK